MDYVFEVIDKSRRKITLTKRQWSHMTKKHPYIEKYIEEIKETLISPDKWVNYLDKGYYYKSYKYLKRPNHFILVIVKYLNRDVIYHNSLFKGKNKMTEENQTYDIYYDKEGDFLELTFGEPAQEGTTEEIEKGIFITRDINSKEIKNIGILDFKKRVEVLKKILQKVNLDFPLEINFAS